MKEVNIKMQKDLYDSVVAISRKENTSLSTVINTAVRIHMNNLADFEHLHSFKGYVKRVLPEEEYDVK